MFELDDRVIRPCKPRIIEGEIVVNYYTQETDLAPLPNGQF